MVDYTITEYALTDSLLTFYFSSAVMAPHFAPDLSKASLLFSNASVAATVAAYMNNILLNNPTTRALVAMAQTSTPWNSDDFNGFGVERKKILDMVKTDSNNPIMLGGDLHDSWAWTMYEGGNKSGTPVAVNLGCPGVTSPGWGGFLGPALSGLAPTIGGTSNVYKLIDDMFYQQNPGLKYAETRNKGFFVVKATKASHTVEYILNSPSTILSSTSCRRTSIEPDEEDPPHLRFMSSFAVNPADVTPPKTFWTRAFWQRVASPPALPLTTSS